MRKRGFEFLLVYNPALMQSARNHNTIAARLDPEDQASAAHGHELRQNVDTLSHLGRGQMVDMLGAARAYQANITAIGLIRDTVARALELAK